MRYRELFGDREFTSLFAADVLSILGSYLSRLAVSALVFARTDSVSLTALAFAVSYLPYLFSPWLSTLADRFPPRPLLIVCDLVRAVLMLLVVIPGLPYPVLIAILFCVAVCRIPFGAVRLSLLSQILSDERFPAGNALVGSARQGLQVSGFAVGGLVISLIGTQPAIIFDAATFALSALIIGTSISSRPATWIPADGDGASGLPARTWSGALEGLRAAAGPRRLRLLLALMGLGPAILVVSEALAVPFAHQLGGSTTLAGIVMAAPPFGTVVGLLVFGRLPVPTQQRLCVPLAVAGMVAVAVAGVVAWLEFVIVTIVVLAIAGFSAAYLNAIQSEIASSIAPHLRGRIFGLANAVIQLSQGVAIVVAGAIATAIQVAPTLVIMGGLGFVGAVSIGSRLSARESLALAREA